MTDARPALGLISRTLSGLLVLLVRVYQAMLSPLLAGQCRYVPTCSEYAIDALRTHGPIRGTRLILRRLARCHPFVKGGYDPVPPSDARDGHPSDS
ncbi:MAG: membrane protein insertion efficiency factor YidD [Phycisphaerales bacterium]|nr:MAG: membrane protein insertion efficiency factor YidD [Phycisphaerales bacterium]